MPPPSLNTAINLLFGLLPVVVFLAVLITLDSFKLVRARAVLGAIIVGCVMAAAALSANIPLLRQLPMSTGSFQKYVAPVVEEILKAAFLVYMIRRKRVGFMVDVAIFGFAVGAGFAIVENLYVFGNLWDRNFLVWIVRGFGTAIMHGSATAIMGIISKQLGDRYGTGGVVVYLPGLVGAIIMHSFYNHFFLSPLFSTAALLIVLSLVTAAVFRVSESATRRWLGVRFDTDAELLDMVNSGRATESRVGEYLQLLRSRFPGEVVADMLCMLRLHLELSIRAKGILLMREAGFDVQPEPELAARFRELKYLEKSVGKTGLLAVSPILNMSNHDLWQLYMLGKR